MAVEYKHCPDNYRVTMQRAAKIRNEARRPYAKNEWRKDHPRPRKDQQPITPKNDKQVTGNKKAHREEGQKGEEKQ